MSELHRRLQELVDRYGLYDVYTDLRHNFSGYCANCGTPVTENEIHQPGNLGMCYIEVHNKRKKPRRDDGKEKDIPG